VFYHPYAYAIGHRDVIAAWLVCLAIAATGVASAAIAAAADSVAEACAISHDPGQHHASRSATPARLRS
jgi:hypothetical protein